MGTLQHILKYLPQIGSSEIGLYFFTSCLLSFSCMGTMLLISVEKTTAV